MKTLKRCFSLLMSAALITGLMCTGAWAAQGPSVVVNGVVSPTDDTLSRIHI